VRRVLEGYDFVLKTENGNIEVTVLAPRKSAAAVAAASPPIAQPAGSSAPLPASAPGNASGSPPSQVPHIASATAAKLAERAATLFPDARAEPSTMPGVTAASPQAVAKIPGMRPVLESARSAASPVR
jgi:hypothetical protein